MSAAKITPATRPAAAPKGNDAPYAAPRPPPNAATPARIADTTKKRRSRGCSRATRCGSYPARATIGFNARSLADELLGLGRDLGALALAILVVHLRGEMVFGCEPAFLLVENRVGCVMDVDVHRLALAVAHDFCIGLDTSARAHDALLVLLEV